MGTGGCGLGGIAVTRRSHPLAVASWFCSLVAAQEQSARPLPALVFLNEGRNLWGNLIISQCELQIAIKCSYCQVNPSTAVVSTRLEGSLIVPRAAVGIALGV